MFIRQLSRKRQKMKTYKQKVLIFSVCRFPCYTFHHDQYSANMSTHNAELERNVHGWPLGDGVRQLQYTTDQRHALLPPQSLLPNLWYLKPMHTAWKCLFYGSIIFCAVSQ